MSELTHAAAFLLGALFATVATIRITRAVVDLLTRRRPKDGVDKYWPPD